jgi:hypothetical protein
VRAEDGRPAHRLADFHLPMGSLPRFFRPTLASFPPECRVLKTDPCLVTKWRLRLEGLGESLKIGLSWRSVRERRPPVLNPYLSLDDCRPLFDLPGIQWVSLQYDDDPRERAGYPLATWPDLDLRNDLEDVTALTSCLDGVVSVANTNISIAGGLGKRALQFSVKEDWTLLGTGELPWYPSVKTVTRPNDLADRSGQVSEALRIISGWR